MRIKGACADDLGDFGIDNGGEVISRHILLICLRLNKDTKMGSSIYGAGGLAHVEPAGRLTDGR